MATSRHGAFSLFSIHGSTGSEDPRLFGKCLKGEFWRFRVDDYRILCQLKDEEFEVLVVRVGHRSDVYD